MIVAASPLVGGGRHIFDVSKTQIETFLELNSFIFFLYPIIITLAKCSIVFFYIRLFGIHRWFRYCCYTLLGFVVGWGFSVFFPTLFMCGSPPSNAWTILGPNTLCIDREKFFVSSTAFDAFFDVVLLILPLRPVWKLKLSTKKKWAITGALLLGTG